MTLNTIEAWHDIAQQRDKTKLMEILADDAVFHSPVVHTPQVGKAITYQYLSAALEVFYDNSFTYVREIKGSHDAMLEFELELDGIKINGVDIIKWNDDGKITEFKVMLRPLKGINLIHKKMGEMLTK